MANLFIANTNFEFELLGKSLGSIEESLKQHPICLQLQFLPVLFASPKDWIVSTVLPPEKYLTRLNKEGFSLPEFMTYSNPKVDGAMELVSWGWSQEIESWAKSKGFAYNIPPWEVVKKVNSKEWSFVNSLKLPQGHLIHDYSQLMNWLKLAKGGRYVLKNCYGLSGRGHCHLSELLGKEEEKKALAFCNPEWLKGYPVIAEPWVERLLDFSSQWKISKEGHVELLGVTKMLNNALGVYLGTVYGPQDELFKGFSKFVEEHLFHAREVAFKLVREGYYGFAGIDAMVFSAQDNKKPLLHPVVEVNARMTMALAAILIREKHFKGRTIQCMLERTCEGLLPRSLIANDKEIRFNRQLIVSIL